MTRLLGWVLVLCSPLTLILSAKTGSRNTTYVGGTIASIPENAQGTSSTADEKVFVFAYNGGRLEIPYGRINTLEYGQKAGRRLGLALVVSPLALFSKKRKHFLTVNYLDDNDRQQAAVFELGKDIVRKTLAAIEARTGRRIEYQDEEARRTGRGD